MNKKLVIFPIVIANGKTYLALQGLNGLSMEFPLFNSLEKLNNFDFKNWKYFL